MNPGTEAWLWWCNSAVLTSIAAAGSGWIFYLLAAVNMVFALSLWQVEAFLKEKKDAPKDSTG